MFLRSNCSADYSKLILQVYSKEKILKNYFAQNSVESRIPDFRTCKTFNMSLNNIGLVQVVALSQRNRDDLSKLVEEASIYDPR